MFKYLELLEKKGLLAQGIRAGVIDPNIIHKRTIYMYYMSIRATGKNCTQSVMDTAVRFNMSTQNIWKILKQVRMMN